MLDSLNSNEQPSHGKVDVKGVHGVELSIPIEQAGFWKPQGV